MNMNTNNQWIEENSIEIIEEQDLTETSTILLEILNMMIIVILKIIMTIIKINTLNQWDIPKWNLFIMRVKLIILTKKRAKSILLPKIWSMKIFKKKMLSWRRNSINLEKWKLDGSAKTKITSKKKSLLRITIIYKKKKQLTLNWILLNKDAWWWKRRNMVFIKD